MVSAMSPLDLRKEKDKTANAFIAILYNKGRSFTKNTSMSRRQSVASVFGNRNSQMGNEVGYRTDNPCRVVWFELEGKSQEWSVRKVDDVLLRVIGHPAQFASHHTWI